MKTLVLYTSVYGSTQQYAEWIAQELDAVIGDINKFDMAQLDGYDTIILGTYVRVGKLVAGDYLKKIWPRIQNKKVVLFSVSKTPVNSEATFKNYRKSVPEKIRAAIQYFPLEGRFVFNELVDKDKTTMRIGQKMTRIFMGKAMAEEMVRDCDDVRSENLQPLFAALRSIS
ncbi:flavodoxin domain-containing protein [Paenibacillus lutimineralis]|uniref:Flavodoxin domain-containing protein n=1 Tax=Paenibacillus lutimineralis TaxID=2707005 RepID=A0A3S9UV48_9BACL|nr:flavodoxin domain-containing protein [Paenibacillus lutimineralis]AZS14170.1 hypothetical protein EI981_06670 [Paenibacillus lutimineralis]